MSCDYCQLEMTAGVSCTLASYDDIKGGPHARIPYGSPREVELFWLSPDGLPANCGDCKTPLGGFHHPGCDVERCPACGLQAISCDCTGET